MSDIIDMGTRVAAAKSASEKPVSQAPNSEPPFIHMRRGEQRITGDYNTIDVMESEGGKIAKLEMWLAKRVGAELVSLYPGRQWGVQVDIPNRVAVVTCPSLAQDKGYFLHLKDETPAQLATRASKAAGEILERYGVSRARNFDSELLDHLDRDIRDDVISADAAPEPLK